MRRKLVCVIDHTILLAAAAWEDLPWKQIINGKHRHVHIDILIPSCICNQLNQYISQALDAPLHSFVVSALERIPEAAHREHISIAAGLDLSIMTIEDEQFPGVLYTPDMMLRCMTRSYRQHPMHRLLLWTQNESLLTRVREDGFRAEPLCRDSSFTPVLEDAVIRTLYRHEASYRHPLQITAESLNDRHLVISTKHEIAQEVIGKIHEAVLREFPKEAMFRIPNTRRGSEGITYAVPFRTISQLIRSADAQERSVIEILYESWANSMLQWIRDVSCSIVRFHAYSSAVIIIEQTRRGVLKDIFLSLRIARPCTMIPVKSVRSELDPPRLPVLTQRTCVGFDDLPIKQFLRLWGIESDHQSRRPPCMFRENMVEQENTFNLRRSSSEELVFHCRSLSQGSIAEIPISITASESSLSEVSIICTYESLSTGRVSKTLSLPVRFTGEGHERELEHEIGIKASLCI